jgi:hypothetical protein
MKLDDFVNGINILRQYYDKPDGYHIGAEHDEFYMYATDKPVSAEDVKKLLTLGWFQTDGGAHLETPQDYNVESGWMAFT